MSANSPVCDAEYDFTLVLSGISGLAAGVEDALFEAGCDDATVSVRSGRVYLTFSRSAASLKDAIVSAIQNVRAANVGADVLRVDECSLVTQSEIARRIRRSRQQVHQYMTGTRGPGGFPGPACFIADRAPLWYWCEVAAWLCENNIVKGDVLKEAQQIEVINAVLELSKQRQATPELTDEILHSVGLN
ncbi:MAG: hypothetical protein WD176_00135 [Pirellulales bacterium]